MSGFDPTRRADIVQTSGPERYALIIRHREKVSMYPLPETGTLEVGRAEDASICIDDDSVSRRHARIIAGSPPAVEDLQSTNGTRVMGQRLAPGVPASLPLGAMVQFGTVTAFIEPNTSNIARIASEHAEVLRSRASATGAKGVVIEDPVMRELYGLIDIIAPSTMPVLILGETGVGKDVYCDTLHQNSPRAKAPFLSLNCAALPEGTLEGELFGYERGAFTGAVQAKPGLFESADGGTVFLDEVGELPMVTQAKLLRVLEKGEVLRLGGLKSKTVDVRFISATNRDLQALAANGRFRSDLFFRLNGVAVTIPPLRRRAADIPALGAHFLRAACKKAGREAPRISDAAMAKLVAYRWPGNIRELRNVIDRAALLCRTDLLGPEHLMFTSSIMTTSSDERHLASEPDAEDDAYSSTQNYTLPNTYAPDSSVDVHSTPSITTAAAHADASGLAGVTPVAPSQSRLAAASPSSGSVGPTSQSRISVTSSVSPATRDSMSERTLRDEFADLERQRILDALERCGGNQSRAAKMLGISRGTLIRRLDAYQVVRPRKRDEPEDP